MIKNILFNLFSRKNHLITQNLYYVGVLKYESSTKWLTS